MAPRAVLICGGVFAVVTVAVEDVGGLLMLVAALASSSSVTILVGLESFVCELLLPSDTPESSARH